ncbi:MAG: GSCFA domain protein [Bacteroidetes bacterium HGW-Bacteroidetes-8]|jgi:hypothetical protein|nr:MAG: GSCFA domain protein [Bacteroidetes bacterium HGW-Bacteroidetes-8]
MRWQTEVLISPLKDRINYKDGIIFMGSCFAAEIGAKMEQLRFKVVVNPFGVLFNPGSISSSLKRIDTCELFTEDDLIKAGDIYKSFSHGSEFASTSKDKFLSQNNSTLKSVSNHYKNCRWVVLTLGTSWVYRERIGGKIVSNCHKLPHSFFERTTMEVDEIVESLSPAIEANPHMRWIITVSPVRHLKEGANGNQLSKARLLLATEILVKRFSNVFYFPAYEIFMDQLRDYRFYAEDMVHPSREAVNYIWEQFCSFALDSSCDKIMKQVNELNLLKGHRPMFPESEDYKSLLEKIAILEQKLAKEGL